MSLNFFKKEPKKTDASLSYDDVLDNIRNINTTLNVDEFIQKENIDLHQHQEFYSNKSTEKTLPRTLEKQNSYNVNDTRQFVNSLIEISRTSASVKANVTTLKDKVDIANVENKQTMDSINSLSF